MNGGRFFSGAFVPISAVCREGSSMPSPAPVVNIYDDAGDKVFSASMPLADLTTGLFVLEVQMDASFDGHYTAHISYILGGEPRIAVFYFEALAVGGPKGAVVSMAFYDRPHARFLLQRLDSNQRRIVRNPRGG
jgi:hypothetical protein